MIASLTPFTLLDYPSKLACIIWFGGCNLRCQYCYNFEFLNASCTKIKEEEVLTFLKARQGFLDGVVLSGGECTIWGERLIRFAQQIKELGFCLKLDSNATNPEVLQRMIDVSLLDYIALDFKAPREKYAKICGIKGEKFDEFEQCVKILNEARVDYEIRTTFHSELLSLQDLQWMEEYIRSLGYKREYYVQGFVGDKGSLGNLLESNNASLKEVKNILMR